MPTSEELTDAYLAELLKKDAKAVSTRIASSHSNSISKRPSTALKPNTRFLKNILRDTDSHNAALLAKEAEESQARLKRLKEREKKGRKRPEQAVYSVRARREIGGDSGGDKRRTTEARSGRDRGTSGRRADGGERRRKHEWAKKGVLAVSDEGEEDDYRVEHLEGADLRNARPRRKEAIERSESPRQGRRGRHLSTERRPKPVSRSRSPERRQRRARERSYSPRTSASPKRSSRSSRRRNASVDSDSLDDFLGPRPAGDETVVRSRGRGVNTDKSTIDRHFSSSYDPAADTALDDEREANDWDQALEALHDRQTWKEQGARRLKAAGFTDEEIQKWRKGGKDDEASVKWKKAGEGRDWDRGKVAGSDIFTED